MHEENLERDNEYRLVRKGEKLPWDSLALVPADMFVALVPAETPLEDETTPLTPAFYIEIDPEIGPQPFAPCRCAPSHTGPVPRPEPVTTEGSVSWDELADWVEEEGFDLDETDLFNGGQPWTQ